MKWIRGLLLSAPFLVAAVLTVLTFTAGRFQPNLQNIAGYGFLFGAPWAWLLDHNWFPGSHRRAIAVILDFAIILWIPALLYSSCIWLLFLAFRRVRGKTTGR